MHTIRVFRSTPRTNVADRCAVGVQHNPEIPVAEVVKGTLFYPGAAQEDPGPSNQNWTNTSFQVSPTRTSIVDSPDQVHVSVTCARPEKARAIR